MAKYYYDYSAAAADDDDDDDDVDDDGDCTVNADRRRGVCWMTVRGDQCEDEVRSDVTKADCCASIGKAWGSPCELCPVDDGAGPGSLVEPTPGVAVGPEGGPPVGPGACFGGFSQLCDG